MKNKQPKESHHGKVTMTGDLRTRVQLIKALIPWC